MNLDRIIHALTPPALAWCLGRAGRETKEQESLENFYRLFVAPGDLCFDIGANLGTRTRCFEHLGCTVVAVEPQAGCFNRLATRFGGNQNIRLVQAAVAREPGRATLHVSPGDVLSTLSQSFIDGTTRSGGFSTSRWNHFEEVEMTTQPNFQAMPTRD